MSSHNCSDGNSDYYKGGEDLEDIYAKYYITNKRLSSMENEVAGLRTTIENHAMTLQNERQIREIYQLALLDEQIRHSECRADYLRLSNYPYSQAKRGDEETTDRSQAEHLLTVIGQLKMKIQTMKEQHSGALCVAADHIIRTERALERVQMRYPANQNPVSNEVDAHNF
ncbi:hypothetical protein ACMFMG_011711 [Clarireedia jacksonii]